MDAISDDDLGEYAKNLGKIITDRGKQFDCDCFRGWCFPHIFNRYGAVGKYGSIAVVERFMRTLKDQHTR